jgi:hypothetical protein
MPLKERRARHEALFAAVCEHDVDRWQREFLAAVRGDTDRDYNPRCNTLGYSDSSAYQKDGKMLAVQKRHGSRYSNLPVVDDSHCDSIAL